MRALLHAHRGGKTGRQKQRQKMERKKIKNKK
jgi:hypothetical protein